MILVTGGTGLVGAHLLYKLCETQSQVVAIYRTKENQNTTKEIFELYGNVSLFDKIIWKKADITDVPTLELVFKDITHVYHAAAMVSFATKDQKKMREINIVGTSNIVNLCLENNIQKLCYVSSIATLAKTPGIPQIDESCEWNPEGDHSDYSISKFGGEMEVWRGSQEGLNVVIVNPGVIFGFGAWTVNTGKLFHQIKKGMPFYTKGITGVVAVSDVVKAMITLMNSDITNERFVLVAGNISYREIFTQIATALGVKVPKIYMPKWATEIAWRTNRLFSVLSLGIIPYKVNKYSMRASHKQRDFVGTKINRSIDFNYTPIDMTIKEIASKLS